MKSPGSANTVSRYRIISNLGEGNMGVVCKAVDTELERTVSDRRVLIDAEAKVIFSCTGLK